jgi:hypothetical protein
VGSWRCEFFFQRRRIPSCARRCNWRRMAESRAHYADSWNSRLAATELPASLENAYRLILKGIVSTQCGDNPRYIDGVMRKETLAGAAQRPSPKEAIATEVHDHRNRRAEDVYHLLQLRTEGALLLSAVEVLGGIEAVAKILNECGASMEKTILDYLDGEDPALAEEIRNQMVTFADIARMPHQDIELLLQLVDSRDMAVALTGVDEKVRDRFLSNMSDSDPLDMSASAFTGVQEAMAGSRPVGAADVADAQIRIVQQMRQLEEAGRVTIVRGEGV